jgi:hypothetical protein
LREGWSGFSPGIIPSLFVGMAVGGRGMVMRRLALFLRRGSVLFRVVVRAEIVQMGRLMVMKGSGVVVSDCQEVVLPRRMLR